MQGAGCFSPNFWLGASQPEHTPVPGGGLDYSTSFLRRVSLCSLLHREAAGSLLELGDAPAMATKPFPGS